MNILLQSQNTTLLIAVLSGLITVIVAMLGVMGNWYLSIQNRKHELVLKSKEIEQKEYQFLLENLKSFWEYQNNLYTETLKTATVLVFNENIRSEKFLSAYQRFWELYYSDLPTCESSEIELAMVNIKDLIYDKKHLDPDDTAGIDQIKKKMKKPLLELSTAVRKSSLLLEYSEKLKLKIRAQL